MEQGNPVDSEARLNELFRAYRAACPDPDINVNFMPDLWARIEAREISTSWFARVARALVTAALAGSAILGLMISSTDQSGAFFNATFLEALRADYAATLEPLHIDRISELDPQ
jgi:hypothetical protein